MIKFIFIAGLILTLCFDNKAIYPNDNPELKGSFGNELFYYLSLHPGIAKISDSVASLAVFSLYDNDFYVERKDIGFWKNYNIPINNFKEVKYTAGFIQAVYDSINPDEFYSYERIIPGAAIKIMTYPTDNCYLKTNYGNKFTDRLSLLSVSEYGNRYQISNFPIDTNSKNYVSIVGVYDNTKVTFILGGGETCQVKSENGKILKSNDSIKVTLNESDVWFIPAYGSSGYLTGSVINSNKPVAVYSGSAPKSTDNNILSNYTINQEIPKNSWISEFLVPLLFNQKTSHLVTIISKSPNSKIYFDGDSSFTTTSIGKNYIITKAGLSQEPKPLRISSDSLIDVVITNPGTTDENSKILPFLMQIAQSSNNVVFDIENPDEDFINIIYKVDSNSTVSENLKVGEIINNEFVWKKLLDFSPGLGSRFVHSDKDGSYQLSKNIKFNTPGTYIVKSVSNIIVYKYGIGKNKGYGYPLFGAYFNFMDFDTLAPTVEYGGNCNDGFKGTVTDEPISNPEICSHLGIVYLDTDDSHNFSFSVTGFVAGVDNSTDWQIRIRDYQYDARAHLVFIDRAGNRKDTVIECKNETSIKDYDDNKSIDIIAENGILKFKSGTDYTIDEIEIYDIMCKPVYKNSTTNNLNNYSVKISDFTIGVYLLKFRINNIWIMKKFIVKS